MIKYPRASISWFYVTDQDRQARDAFKNFFEGRNLTDVAP